MSLHTVCFTGHRELPDAASTEYRSLIRDTQEAIVAAIQRGATDFYAGGAKGYDLLCAELVLSLQEQYPQIRLHIILPYADFARGERYKEVLSKADEVWEVNSAYRPGCLMMRNRRLVEEGDLCIAYLRQNSGGTFQTVTMAKKLDREVFIV